MDLTFVVMSLGGTAVGEALQFVRGACVLANFGMGTIALEAGMGGALGDVAGGGLARQLHFAGGAAVGVNGRGALLLLVVCAGLELGRRRSDTSSQLRARWPMMLVQGLGGGDAGMKATDVMLLVMVVMLLLLWPGGLVGGGCVAEGIALELCEGSSF